LFLWLDGVDNVAHLHEFENEFSLAADCCQAGHRLCQQVVSQMQE
jgi:hypothetical protein